MDLLADVLAISGVRSTLGARIEAGADWGWYAVAGADAAFHAVTAGTAWLAVPGQAPRELMPGDVVLLPRGGPHVLASDRDALLRTTGVETSAGWEQGEAGVVAIGTGPVRTHILCAHYAHDPVVSTQVLALLPDLVH
ncbi:MAG TPA: cupin domain-containing protein, partial [Baekduia sp.]|nr:cupin domain-containing protein [Baekduia sp.]